ncbi:STAS domain-containing protein [Pseudonocardia acaciae]|uniref:STAS domain-containing protein n=1 Tax=Pseudonocardia acaciae TaxID=551276 RepID=UPI0014705AF2|nr:STAS domain-containing protein [Pseudonocardia acaciae]
MNIAEPGIDTTPRIHAYAAVSVDGRLDRAGIARVRAELAGWRAAGAIEVRLDLSGVTSYEPSLARTLAWVRSQLCASGGDLMLTGADERLRAELRDAVGALDALPGWRGGQLPPRRGYRPETADQP